jgi:hypothetical protein
MTSYTILARLASQRANASVTLASSAPLASTQGAGELTSAVELNPEVCRFVATTREGARTRLVFTGPSLTLACAAANQALEARAPLESLIQPPEDYLYRRTRPQYLQEVHFCDALRRLGELAAADRLAA